ncbi:uncharacterized protein LOC130053535 [Ostrea edulis]|uniref:uncharacterized protein LOC130053535 n=1 Tax=Ostrea edulis TaxID=37623 RepID=UPI0024AEFBEB|nr:uncharacterized protein LOC130053535 [Ostrea edulis]
MKFSNKVDEYRVKRREKMKLPGTKRRRLILKQERAMQMNASKASEGSTYQPEIGLGTEADIEQIPDPIPKPNFGAVQKLKNMEANQTRSYASYNSNWRSGDIVWKCVFNLSSAKYSNRARSRRNNRNSL